jgi:hypothetical protein
MPDSVVVVVVGDGMLVHITSSILRFDIASVQKTTNEGHH